jgi:hypothetical protein
MMLIHVNLQIFNLNTYCILNPSTKPIHTTVVAIIVIAAAVAVVVMMTLQVGLHIQHSRIQALPELHN